MRCVVITRKPENSIIIYASICCFGWLCAVYFIVVLYRSGAHLIVCDCLYSCDSHTDTHTTQMYNRNSKLLMKDYQIIGVFALSKNLEWKPKKRKKCSSSETRLIFELVRAKKKTQQNWNNIFLTRIRSTRTASLVPAAYWMAVKINKYYVTEKSSILPAEINKVKCSKKCIENTFITALHTSPIQQ